MASPYHTIIILLHNVDTDKIMAHIGNLHTISDKHSIKEAVVSFILSTKITEIDTYRNLVGEEGALHDKFQKFEVLNIQGVQMSQQLDQTNLCTTKELGFKLVSFEDGKTKDVIQALPQHQNTVLTYNTVKYVAWDEFKARVTDSISEISKLDPNLNIIGVGVMFIDEFYFDKYSDYEPSVLFNVQSKNLPESILDSDLVDYNLNTQSKKNDINYIENISLRVFNQNEKKIIRITGNTMILVNHISFNNALKEAPIDGYLDFGHDENKAMLRDILSSQTLKIINL